MKYIALRLNGCEIGGQGERSHGLFVYFGCDIANDRTGMVFLYPTPQRGTYAYTLSVDFTWTTSHTFIEDKSNYPVLRH